MKKFIGLLGVILMVLCLLIGCKGDPIIETANPARKVVILQAYGNGGEDAAPAGVSHSFVELYNITDNAIDLTGTTLWFANGRRGLNVTLDEAWQSIKLDGKTIPAKGSLLILGKKHSAATAETTRLMIEDNSGDINNDTLELSRRGFKVALIYGANELGVNYPNPYSDGLEGKPISGYVDMVGAVNNPNNAENPDNIFGFEKEPARNSASEAVRRNTANDTDNNKNDFIRARYALGNADGDNYPSMTDEQLEAWKPRNSSAGTWDAFSKPIATTNIPGVDYTKLKLNEVSGVGNDPEKFYELINIGDADIPLEGVKIYYNANGSTEGTLPSGKGNLTWTGAETQIAQAGELFSLIGRNNEGSFTTGLTAARVLIITLEDPEGNVIDQCIRAADTGDYAFTDKSFSRIPDGTGDFYFTDPTPDATNGTSTAGLTKLLSNPPIITGFSRVPNLVTPPDGVTVKADIKVNTGTISSVVIKWTVDGTAQTDITMTASGDTYSGVIPEQALDSVVAYKVVAAAGEDTNSVSSSYTVVSGSVDYSPLMITEISGEHKYVEIYNSGDDTISLYGVKLQRNEQGNSNGNPSEWLHKAGDTIPAKAYRLYLFSGYTPTASTAYSATGTSTLVDKVTGLETYEAYKGWGNTRFDNGNAAGLSDQQILRIALVDPNGNVIDIFIRGDDPLPSNANGINWGGSATRVQTHSYSRMSDGTWAYAVPTPGAANGAKVNDIVNPGYLTSQP